jgi:hypothetical protein
MRVWTTVAAAVITCSCALVGPAPGLAQAADAIDCTGPADDPAPATAEWAQREQENDWCGEQRIYDTSANPLFLAANAAQAVEHGGQVHEDAFRDPATWNGARGRYQALALTTLIRVGS